MTMDSAIPHMASIGSRYGNGGSRKRPDAEARPGEHRPVVREVRREEHHQDDLEQLRWLAAERANDGSTDARR